MLARERDEGDCADSGLVTVKNRYGDAYVDVAKGRVAEESGDAAGAVTAYRAALAIDGDNPACHGGMSSPRFAKRSFRPRRWMPRSRLSGAPSTRSSGRSTSAPSPIFRWS